MIKMDARAAGNLETPRVIRMHADDNVAIVANEFGLPAGAQLPPRSVSTCHKATR